MGEEKRTLSCTDCGVLNCHKRNASYPEFCLTEKLTDEDIAETTALYEDEENRKVSVISAEIEGEFYGKYTRVDEIIEFAELWDFLDVPIKNFSSGMQARLGFAIATMVRPDILVVDEILSVGDYQFQEKCYKRMEDMLSGGTTLLYVSHDVQSVRKLCDHAIWIDKGVVRKSGLVEEVTNEYMNE